MRKKTHLAAKRRKVGDIWVLKTILRHPNDAASQREEDVKVGIIEVHDNFVIEEVYVPKLDHYVKDGDYFELLDVAPQGIGWKQYVFGERFSEKWTCWRRRCNCTGRRA
jgi:hypothetical protein